MRSFLNEYEIELSVIGPVFVGSGKELNKKEYLFLKGNTEIGVLDINSFYSYVKSKGLTDRFEEFFVNAYNSDLRRWLSENDITTDDIKPFLRYRLNCGDTALQRGTIVQIMEIIKDAYGNPYIPGSTLKGMLRTILLSKEIKTHPDLYLSEKRRIIEDSRTKRYRTQYLAANTRGIEGKAFNILNREGTKPSDAVNDILSGIIISDSDALTMDDCVLCQRVERHTDGTEKRLNVLRESIKPGTKIKSRLTIDSSVCNISPEMIMEAVNMFDDIYFGCFSSAFPDVGERNDTVFVGGGTGFATKTALYPLMGKEDGMQTAISIFENTGVPGNHGHHRDIRLGASPHILKCTVYEGKTLQMGECKISIKC